MNASVEVVVSNESGLTQQIRSGEHVWYSDEPPPFGNDKGPSPYELLLSSLGACTSMTLQLYAKRKQWDLRQVTVRLKHFRVHADDCMNCETQEGFIDRIDRNLELVGTLDDSQKKRLIEIAERCPVHRTLKSKIDIQTHLTPNK